MNKKKPLIKSLAGLSFFLFSMSVIVGLTLIKSPTTSYVSADAKLSNSKTISSKVGRGTTTKNTSPTPTTTSPAPTTHTSSSSSTTSIAPMPTSSQVEPTFTTAALYANPSSNVAISARAWATDNPGDGHIMNRLASTPMAAWFGDFSGNIGSAVNNYVTAANSVGQIPVLVAYNLPQRDCGSYSSGGASSAAGYQTWISQFAGALANRKAIVIVEPDALAGIDCLSQSGQQERLGLLSYAVKTLRENPETAVYLDAGHANWQSAETMASRLSASDVAEANGFSLNVSNFQTTSSSIAYGDAISTKIGGKHFVIDTSRNGNGPDNNNDWCNPLNASFGKSPTLSTGEKLVDAYLWVKNPGESDGNCGTNVFGTSAPSAGAWWPQYALLLGINSSW